MHFCVGFMVGIMFLRFEFYAWFKLVKMGPQTNQEIALKNPRLMAYLIRVLEIWIFPEFSQLKAILIICVLIIRLSRKLSRRTSLKLKRKLSGLILCRKKALYGLKQAPRAMVWEAYKSPVRKWFWLWKCGQDPLHQESGSRYSHCSNIRWWHSFWIHVRTTSPRIFLVDELYTWDESSRTFTVFSWITS